MGKRPKKKVVLILVEGQSDVNALSYALPEYFENIDEDYEVYFPTLHDDSQDGGDITSKYGIKPENIENCIYKLFLHDFLRDYGLYPKDISEIIQIVDLDGAFVPKEKVVPLIHSSSDKNVIYKDDVIEAKNVESIVERNARKTENLNHLVSLDTIKVMSKTVKYSVYYFSSNLDHYLHGEANLDAREKCIKASAFSDKCIDNLDVFTKTFLPPASAFEGMDYSETWDFVKEGTNSLGRYSNLHILLERIAADTEES